MKKLFKMYEELSNKNCLIRFIKFSEVNFSKVNCKKIKKYYDEFILFVNNNYELRIAKNYENFKDFVLSKSNN